LGSTAIVDDMVLLEKAYVSQKNSRIIMKMDRRDMTTPILVA
jgi:hypothetical protein